jgi:hypothetical protein
MVRGGVKKFVVGKERRRAGSHIRKNHSSSLLTRIRGMANKISVLAPAGFAGLFETVPMNVVEPTVVKTPEPAVFDPAVAQVGPSVRAVNSQKPGPSLVVPEQDQIFP